MRIEKSLYNEDVVIYESTEEQMAAIRNYLDGNYGELTALQIEEFRQCEEDPYCKRFDAEHAGMFSSEVDPLDFRGLVFVYDLGRTFEEGYQILLDMVGPHPITPLTIWRLERELYDKYVTQVGVADTQSCDTIRNADASESSTRRRLRIGRELCRAVPNRTLTYACSQNVAARVSETGDGVFEQA